MALEQERLLVTRERDTKAQEARHLLQELQKLTAKSPDARKGSPFQRRVLTQNDLNQEQTQASVPAQFTGHH